MELAGVRLPKVAVQRVAATAVLLAVGVAVQVLAALVASVAVAAVAASVVVDPPKVAVQGASQALEQLVQPKELDQQAPLCYQLVR